MQPALTASQQHLTAWHPASICYALYMLGELVTDTRATFPPKLTAAVTAWQAAAVAALRPQLQRLLPASLIQLLMGCNRIGMGTGQASSRDQQQEQQGRKEIDSSSSSSEQQLLQTAVLTAAVMALSQQLEALTGEQLVMLLLACSSVDTADKEFGEAILAQLEAKLK